MKSYLYTNRIYRDRERAKVSGVCAGLAKHFGKEPWMVRAAALVSLLVFPMPTAVAYLLAVILIPGRDY